MARLLPSATAYHQPKTLTELDRLLGTYTTRDNPEIRPLLLLAGGTSLAFSRPDATTVIDLTDLPIKGCSCDPDGAVRMGAVTTIGDMERDPMISAFCGGILRQATDTLASTPLRNLITIGGNIAAGYAWCDLPVVLLALDAQYELFPSGTIHNLPQDGSIPFRRLTGPGEVILQVILNARFAAARGAFIDFARTSTDL
ncbi:FAD binding domain-containing protein, partial [bacterium]|nr:FAD binding domain-containing protein [candidate division CSSED10-310 bacterium]